jgi:hypothetical protein
MVIENSQSAHTNMRLSPTDLMTQPCEQLPELCCLNDGLLTSKTKYAYGSGLWCTHCVAHHSPV